MAQYSITGVTKEGSVILISVETKPNPIKIDCRTMSITSYTGRQVMHFPASVTTDGCPRTLRWAVEAVKERIKGYGYGEFERLEMFIQHLDLIDNPSRVPRECPQGYIKWVQDNDYRISTDSLAEFINEKQVAKMSTSKKEVYEKLITNWSKDSSIVRWWINLDDEKLITKFIQIFKTSIKSFTWCMRDDLIDFYHQFINHGLGREACGENWVDTLDGNRDFRHNINTFIALKNKERNDKILATENRFRKITELSNDKFVIIVPSDIEDFTKEGEMQNNCVGSYYHDSIAEGRNFIYFIRKAKNPNHSYITNRFTLSCGLYTCESRKVNNDDNDDREAIALIHEIDKMIKEIIEQEEKESEE